jgi:cysteinyl-tRNA synthetase
LDFSWESMAAAQENLKTIEQLLRRLAEVSLRGTPDSIRGTEAISASPDPEVIQQFSSALADDLNTAAALAVINTYIHTANQILDKSSDAAAPGNILATLHAFDAVLGIIGPLEQQLALETIPDEIQQLAQQREAARQAKDFAKADDLRTAIEAKGYTLEDTASGPRILRQDK